MAGCSNCGKNIGLLDRVGNTLQGRCRDCSRLAREGYVAILESVATGARLLPETAADISKASEPLPGPERKNLGTKSLLQYAERILGDDVINITEEDHFLQLANMIGIDNLQSEFPDLLNRLLIARINDGRLPVIDAPNLMTKRGEVVHLETVATALKEQTVREWRGGSSGYSFRIMKGVSYRTGSSRGRMVPVGTQVVPEDVGTLSISSTRAVFLGRKTTIDMPYTRLVGLELFADGLRLSLTNRKNAITLQTSTAEVCVAMINGAMQRLD